MGTTDGLPTAPPSWRSSTTRSMQSAPGPASSSNASTAASSSVRSIIDRSLYGIGSVGSLWISPAAVYGISASVSTTSGPAERNGATSCLPSSAEPR